MLMFDPFINEDLEENPVSSPLLEICDEVRTRKQIQVKTFA